MHGFGRLFEPDGYNYVGHFSQNKHSGFGIMKQGDGNTYEGFWNDNKQHGVGKYIDS